MPEVDSQQRVVVTGVGLITPLGRTAGRPHCGRAGQSQPRHGLARLSARKDHRHLLRGPLGLEDRLAVYDLCDKHKIATYTLADVQRDRETTQRLGF